ncbi:carboxypeptidase regulatory-like domain-containing protein [Plantactinospora sp. WMMB334]|uniref:carboxypeptidase regulatory-like domain-containing protein n=1 Tax=Plantactinospora sp. WMMB334 TaxID=3404119 RepID=UPI003B93EF3A
MRISLLRRAALCGAAIAATVLAASPPAFAAPAGSAATGAISGRLTTSAGTGAANAWIGIYDADSFDFVNGATTGEDGRYTFDDVAAGSYLVEFVPESGPRQYYRQKSNFWDADPVTVAAGTITTVDDQLFASGILTGQLRTATGEPAADMYVSVRDDESGEWSGGLTDADGRYRISALPGTYVVSFQPIPGSYQEQYVPGKLDPTGASRFEVRADAETVADDTVLPVGSLAGTFTDQAGEPMSEVYVSLQTTNGHYAGDAGYTGADGRFEVPALLAGAYQLSFMVGEQTQYYRGKLSAEDADPVVIRGAETTRITEKQLATGSIRITAVDAITGAPVGHFCVQSECGSGSVTLPDLPKGTHDLYLYTEDGSYHNKELLGVRVGAGRTTERTVKLRPAAVITTTVVDRATGRPVADVCVAAFRPKQAALQDGYGNCSDSTGRIRVGRLTGGEHRLFVETRGTVYGRQWVGPDGGTGDERQAAVVTATVGQTATAPQIKLDRAGTVTGRVTDAATGAPIDNAFISVLTAHPGVGVGDAYPDEDGRYTLERLGPYDWPVVVHAYGYASQWSGGAPSRYTATPVTVTAGASVSNDVAVTAGSEVTGTFTNADGLPFSGGYLLARNAQTGDIAGNAWISDGRFTMRVTGSQRIYFTYNAAFRDGEDYYDGTYRVTHPDGTTTVPRFKVPASGALTVNLVVPTS